MLLLSAFAMRWLLAVLQYPGAAFDLCPLRACRLLVFAGVWPPAFRLCLEAPCELLVPVWPLAFGLRLCPGPGSSPASSKPLFDPFWRPSGQQD